LDSDELRWTDPSDGPEQGTSVGDDIEPDDHGDDVDDLTPGSHLGRYAILSRQGVGGMGVVYAAYDPQLDRRVALKLMHRRSGTDAAQAARRLLAEAKASAQFSHPNVITIHDVGTWEGRVFLAMEFVEGAPLSKWMREPGRDWQDILDVFTRAGRGLEAAHEAGLVHRDFKPDNVLVGIDGRVRVLDFGLARRFDGSVEPLERRDREAGTPAYMSPEQHLGKPLDHRSDQFSFCVALYEALYGELPFSARTRFELALAVTDGRVGPAPRGAGVPNWVRYALLRGLDPEPAGRWADMGELLDALARDPYHGVRQVMLGIAAALLVIGSGVVLLALGDADEGGEPDDPCAYGEERLGLAWNEASEEALRANVDDAIVERLGEWAREWAAMHRSACEATLVHRVQSEVTLDRRMLCLDQRLAEFDGVVRLLVAGRPELLVRAREAVDALPDLEPCADARVLTNVREPAPSGELRERVAALDRSLAHARTLEFAGDYRQALLELEDCVAQARELGFDTRLARAELARGRLELEFGALERADAAIESALVASERAGDDMLRGQALVVGVELALARHDLVDAGRRAVHAEAVLERVGAPDVDRVALVAARAQLEFEAGRPVAAEQQLRDAIAQLAALEPKPSELAELQLELARVLAGQGELEPALEQLDAAERVWSAQLGDTHPVLARVELERGALEQARGRGQRAEAALARALALRERAFGRDSREVGETLVALASLEQAREQPQAALAHLQRAATIFAAQGPSGAEALAELLERERLVRLDLHGRAP
jgi:tetratricopeptide (TPR) repeat protein